MAGRAYVVYLPTGTVVLADRTELAISYGWVRYGADLVHQTAGITLAGAGAAIHPGRPAPPAAALAGARQLNRDDLLRWLLDHGGLAGPVPGIATGLGWQQVTEVHGGQQWIWNGPGGARDLPPGLDRGHTTAQGMRCLTDSLAQLLRPTLPEGQRGRLTLDFLLDWFLNNLPVSGEAYGQMLASQTVDVWSVLPTFTSMFQVRVQVFQHVWPDPADPQAPPFETILASHLEGPPVNQDGNPTPVLHLYWSSSRPRGHRPRSTGISSRSCPAPRPQPPRRGRP